MKPVRRSPNPTSRSFQQQKNNDQTEVSINEFMSRLRELEKIAVEKFRNKGQKQLNILSNSGIKRFNQGLLPELEERPHYIPNIHMAGFDDPDKKKKRR